MVLLQVATDSLSTTEFVGIDIPEIENILFQVWCEVLNLSSVNVESNFFDIGGTSLLSITVLSKIQSKLETASDLSIVHLYQYPTITSLAAYLSKTAKLATSNSTVETRAKKQRNAFKNMKRFASRRKGR